MNDWENAKILFDELEFPKDTEGWKAVSGRETHDKKKEKHLLATYTKYIAPIMGYEVEAKYNYCKECNQIRNKRLVMFNNDEPAVAEKWFVYKGKDVDGQSIFETAKEIFTMALFVLLIIN